MTHDDKRHGTTTLFAALDVVTGACDGLLPAEPSPQEFLTFLTTIDTEVPEGLDVHLILDNYAAQKHPNVQTWLARRPRFQLARHPHLLVVVEPRRTLVRELTDKALRRGVFHSVLDLIAAIEDYINAHNNDPKPLVWTATADDILAKVARGRVALSKMPAKTKTGH